MNHAQEMVNQAADQAAKIAEGAGLNIAFKSQPGQLILGSIMDRFADKLEQLLFDRQTEESVLRLYNELQGILQVCGDLGDSMKQAVQVVARNSIQSKLRTQRINGGGES